jgi:hypothetical protein
MTTIANGLQLAQAGSTVPGTPTGDAPAVWYDKIINDPVNLISISLAVIAVILGIIPLVLYVVEKKRARLLEETIKMFSIYERLQQMKTEAEKQAETSQAQVQEARAQAQAMQDDIEKRLPNAALTAYYQNTIPQIELQVLDLSTRLSAMRTSLGAIQGEQAPMNPAVQAILSEVVSANVGARRRLEQLQLVLVIATAFTSAILAAVPFPLSFVIAVPTGLYIAATCYNLVIVARVAYPDYEFFSMALSRRRILVFGVLFVALLVFSVAALILFIPRF